MARVYVRKFDHDEARRRYAAGESKTALAREYSVSSTAVARVVDRRVAKRMYAYTRAGFLSVCEECRGPAIHNPYNKRRAADGRILCHVCRGKAARTALEYTPGGVAVAAWCAACKRMLPFDEFPRGQRFKDVRPGGIHNSCRECQTVLRRNYREARKVPCSHGCGTLVLHERPDPNKPSECQPCAIRRVNATRTRKQAA